MVRLTHATSVALVGLLALTGCPGDDVPITTEGDSGSDTTGDPTPVPTSDPTPDPDTGTDTMVVDDTGSSDGSPVCEPACADDQCCVGGACFDAPEPVCNPGCADTEVCACPEGSDPCDCVAECITCGIEGDSYDPCIGVECPAGTACIADDVMDPTFAVCAVQGCGDDACACPLPPDSGTALNACGEFAGDKGNGSCFLDCSGGATCPDDMVCRTLDGLDLCVWPGEDIESDCCFPNGSPGCDTMDCQDAVCALDAFCCDMEWDQICADNALLACDGLCGEAPPTLGPWGDCVNNDDPCDLGDTCATADLPPLFGWCSTNNCVDVGDCPPEPPGGDAPIGCGDIGLGFNSCFLDCAMGETCPTGMICGLDAFCGWPEVVEGFGNCGEACQTDEVCVTDGDPMMMVPPTYAYCSDDTCMDASECDFGPPEYDAMAMMPAPVTCGDPSGMGGANTCYLDCSGGEDCPLGMACTDTSFCAWPVGGSILSTDFTPADVMMPALPMDWTVYDEDMQVVFDDPSVNFVTDAWVASDAPDMMTNWAAVSTSWYDPAGISDDWLVTPQIMLGPNTRLYWQSRSFSADFADGFEVWISTAGPTPAEFMDAMTGEMILSVAAEDTSYTDRFIDLATAGAGYMGQPVHIAWRNNSDDRWLLMVDNVNVVELP